MHCLILVDDENDTEDENVEEASSAEKEEVLPPTASGEAASSAEKEEVPPPTASGEADTKKTWSLNVFWSSEFAILPKSVECLTWKVSQVH